MSLDVIRPTGSGASPGSLPSWRGLLYNRSSSFGESDLGTCPKSWRWLANRISETDSQLFHSALEFMIHDEISLLETLSLAKRFSIKDIKSFS